MGYSLEFRKYLIVIFSLSILFIAFIQIPSTLAQEEETNILNEISKDWTIDFIIIKVKTDNAKSLNDFTYSNTDITDVQVLKEISKFEETFNPKKRENKDDDGVVFILSISTIIKEINSTPPRFKNAFEKEFSFLGDFDNPTIVGGYSIPDDEERIKSIFEQIPPESRNKIVTDSNNDQIYDTGIILIGITQDIDREKLVRDMNEKTYEFKHCTMTIMYNDDSSNVMDFIFPIIAIGILTGLLLTTILLFKSNIKKPKKNNYKKMKNRVLAIVVIYLILIVVCSTFLFVDTSDHNGQYGMVLVSGRSSAGDNVEDSMCDINVLDEIDILERELNKNEDTNAISIVDFMKIIRPPSELIEPIAYFIENAPGKETNSSQSFWNLIHDAPDSTGIEMNKSLRQILIDIFYNTLSIEIKSMFINLDYSKTVLYIEILTNDIDSKINVIKEINEISEDYSAGRSTSHVTFIRTSAIDDQSIIGLPISIFIIIFLLIGIVIFIFFLYKRNKGDKSKEPQEPIEIT